MPHTGRPHSFRARRKGQSRSGTTRRASGQNTSSNNLRIRTAIGREGAKFTAPKTKDSAPNPSPELSPKAKKRFFNPFNLADRVEEAKNR